MKTFKALLISFSFLLTFLNYASALNVCPGKTATLHWTTANVILCRTPPSTCVFYPSNNDQTSSAVVTPPCSARLECWGDGEGSPYYAWDADSVTNINTAACNADPVGSHDGAGATDGIPSTWGWTKDSDVPSTALDVHLYIDSNPNPIGPISAGLYRSDLTAASIGDHAFSYTFPDSTYCDSVSHSIRAFAINSPAGNNPLLSGSPKTFTCSCPPGLGFTGTNCIVVGPATISVVWNGLPNPRVTTTCPTLLTQTSLTRNGVAVTLNGSGYDTAVVSTVNSQSYTYSVTCAGSGVNSSISRTASATVTIPERVKIDNISNSISEVGASAVATWNSTGNECRVYDISNTLIGSATRSGSLPNYNYSFTLLPGSPQWRTELNSSHTGNNILGYNIQCTDTVEPIRGTAADIFKAEVYRKPIATITGPDSSNDIILSCTPDYTDVDLRENNVSLPSYPKTYTNPPSSNFSTKIKPNTGSVYTLICAYKNYKSIATYPANTLSLSGSISSSNGTSQSGTVLSLPLTLQVDTTNGRLGGMSYSATSFDSWTVDVWSDVPTSGAPSRSGTSANAGNLGIYALDSFGSNSITNNQNLNVYTTNLSVRVTATKSGVTKVIWLILNRVSTAKAIINVVSASSVANPDNVTVSGRCDNSTNYSILMNDGIRDITLSSGSTNADPYYTPIITVQASSTGKSATFKLICVGISGSDTATKIYDLVSKTPVIISAFLISPDQITCPGGDSAATLKWVMSNTVGKVCRINASAINSTSVDLADKATQMTELNTQLASSKYGPNRNQTLGSVMSTVNQYGVSSGQIILEKVARFPNGKRLFNYSTRFKMECDNANAAGGSYSNPTASTYSTKSVNTVSTCVGQN